MNIQLPKWLYNVLPVFYFISGIAFIMGSVYLTFKDAMTPVYVGVGGFSLGLAFVIFSCRKRNSDCETGHCGTKEC